ncbi:hypothetical protein BJV77DRAFT_764715 [Russula vinacea]|nr:hypothetical protein BJV77DRAFT_764715 [Russula vinacea]
MDRTRAVSDDTPQAASPPNVPSKSTNTPPSMTKSADSESRRPASGPTPQKRLSYAEMAKKGLSNERLNGAAGANPAVAPGQSSRRVTRPTGNPPATAVSGATSRSRQPIAERRDTNQFDNELGQRSRGGRQPSSDTDDTQNAPVHPTSSSKPSDISASKQARTAQRDGVTNSAPVLSASSMRVRRSPSFRDASHSRASQETGSNIPPVPPRTEEMREKYGIPIPEVDLPRERTTVRPRAEPDNRTTSVHPSVQPSTPSPSSSTPHERNATRSKAEQVRRTASTQPPFKLSTPPPPPLKRPSASASPSSTAPVSTKMSSSRMHTSRGTLLYESHHASATTESLQRGHKDPSAIRHGPVTRIRLIYHTARLYPRKLTLLRQYLLGRTVRTSLLHPLPRMRLFSRVMWACLLHHTDPTHSMVTGMLSCNRVVVSPRETADH